MWKWLELDTIAWSEAQSYFQMKSDKDSYSGLTLLPFMRRPLLAIEPGLVCVPYLPYLENGLGSGLHFAFLDGYNGQNKAADECRADSDKFTRFFGEFFEDYMVGMLREAHPEPSFVFAERKYITVEGTEGKGSDCVIFRARFCAFL